MERDIDSGLFSGQSLELVKQDPARIFDGLKATYFRYLDHLNDLNRMTTDYYYASEFDKEAVYVKFDNFLKFTLETCIMASNPPLMTISHGSHLINVYKSEPSYQEGELKNMGFKVEGNSDSSVIKAKMAQTFRQKLQGLNL